MALLLKQLHKFFMRADIPWVKLVWSLYSDGAPQAQSKKGSFWWRDVFSYVDIYRSITTCQVREGSTVLFWKDFWNGEEILADKWPHLFSIVENQDLSVRKMVSHQNRTSTLTLPLSVEAFQEYQEMEQLCSDTFPLDDNPDERSFIWGKLRGDQDLHIHPFHLSSK